MNINLSLCVCVGMCSCDLYTLHINSNVDLTPNKFYDDGQFYGPIY